MKFNQKERLGSGPFGFVCRAIDEDGFEVAIKFIDHPELNTNTDIAQDDVDLLRDCHHPNLLNYYGSIRHPLGSLSVLMEYAPLGSVRDIIDDRKAPLAEKEIAFVLTGALRGLGYLHGRGLLHRSVKATNVLLSGAGEVKLADFAVPALHALSTLLSGPLCLPPEVLMRGRATPAADVWALGLLAIEMADGQHPHASHLTVFRMMKQTADLAVPPPTFREPQLHSPALVELVGQCLQKVPERRPSVGELSLHGFLTGEAFDDLFGLLKQRPKMEQFTEKGS